MISVCIPTYEMRGQGVAFLKRSLEMLDKQTYRDFEIVITDNSEDDEIEKLCKQSDVQYFRNPLGITKSGPQNTNAAIRKAKGDLIKILYQDDHLAHPDALKEIAEHFTGQWLITGCNNNPNPYWTGDIHQGNNKLGSPSVLTIKNEYPMFFDEDMRWLYDCDYYKRMHLTHGAPYILSGVHVNIGVGDHQETNILSSSAKDSEVFYMTNKYA